MPRTIHRYELDLRKLEGDRACARVSVPCFGGVKWLDAQFKGPDPVISCWAEVHAGKGTEQVEYLLWGVFTGGLIPETIMPFVNDDDMARLVDLFLNAQSVEDKVRSMPAELRQEPQYLATVSRHGIMVHIYTQLIIKNPLAGQPLNN